MVLLRWIRQRAKTLALGALLGCLLVLLAQSLGPQQQPSSSFWGGGLVGGASSSKVLGGSPAALRASRVAVDGSSERPPYHEYWMGALHRELGPLISKAIYDPQMFVEAVKDPEYLWSIPFFKGAHREMVELPRSLKDHGHQFVFLKRSISVGLGRMHRDAGMELTYNNIETDGEFALFDRAVRHFIGADARHFFVVLQLLIDSMPHKVRMDFADTADRGAEVLGGSDPAWYVASLIDKDTTPAEVNKILKNIKKERLPPNQYVHSAEKVMSPWYSNLPLEKQVSRIHKFHSLIRPSGSCYTIQRDCEDPDGCRFVCNLEYLQNAVQDGKPFGHRLLGVGSNNEYSWETSLLKMFGMTSSHNTTNTIHSITEFDCTLKHGFTPPEKLLSLPVGFGAAEVCIGTQTAGDYMSFADLKHAVLGSEKKEGEYFVKPETGSELGAAKSKGIVARGVEKWKRFFGLLPARAGSADGKRRITRHRMASSSAAGAGGGGGGIPGAAFDSVSIFKCDIEGFEFALLPAWSRSEYEGLSANEALRVRLQDGRTFAMVDFIKEIEFFSVSQFMMEYHASGFGVTSMWQMGHMMLQLHQMGFMMVANERNFYGQQCWETVWVHYRYFVRSEMFVRSSQQQQDRQT